MKKISQYHVLAFERREEKRREEGRETVSTKDDKLFDITENSKRVQILQDATLRLIVCLCFLSISSHQFSTKI